MQNESEILRTTNKFSQKFSLKLLKRLMRHPIKKKVFFRGIFNEYPISKELLPLPSPDLLSPDFFLYRVTETHR